jgi:hypothetical protein
VSGPSLDWIAEARDLITAPDATLDTVAAWLGRGKDPSVERGSDSLRAGPGAVPGASTVTVSGKDGVPDSLAAWYAGETGPTLGEAEAALGEAHELPRLRATPAQVAFPRFEGAAASCFLAATTWDPAGNSGERRLFQLTLRRDPL